VAVPASQEWPLNLLAINKLGLGINVFIWENILMSKYLCLDALYCKWHEYRQFETLS